MASNLTQQHSTINGNAKATRRLLDHGLICEYIEGDACDDADGKDADYYFVEFGNEALKLAATQSRKA